MVCVSGRGITDSGTFFYDYATGKRNKKYRFIVSLCKNDMDSLPGCRHARRQPAPYRNFSCRDDHRQLTEAAQLLHTSQPTVSRELARFEKVLGLKLFERARGRLHPTVQGLRLFEEVQRSWYGLDRFVSAAESLREFRQGELSIACLPVFSQSFLPLLLQPFLPATRTSASISCRKSRRCWKSGSPPSAMIWA
jgi:hypothetical protein